MKNTQLGTKPFSPLLLNVGFGSTVAADRVVAILPPSSAPMKRLKDEAKEERRLVDATHGRKTRSVIVMDSNHVVLSAIQAETIAQRYAGLRESPEGIAGKPWLKRTPVRPAICSLSRRPPAPVNRPFAARPGNGFRTCAIPSPLPLVRPVPAKLTAKTIFSFPKRRSKRGFEEGRWAEWAVVHGNYYGTPADFIQKPLTDGRDILLDIDVQGAEQLMDRFPNSISIFIMPPSEEILRERLEKRGTDDPAVIRRRMENARKEMALKDRYRHIIVNDDLSRAVNQFVDIIGHHRRSASHDRSQHPSGGKAMRPMKTEILYGIHPVTEAIRASRRKMIGLMTADKTAPRLESLMELARSVGIAVEKRSAADLKNMAGADSHQGVAARVEPLSDHGFVRVRAGGRAFPRPAVFAACSTPSSIPRTWAD